jgi:hypothetical protein
MSRQRSAFTFRQVLTLISCWYSWQVRLAARRAVVSLAARGGGCAGVVSGWMAAGVAGFAEQVGERGDGFEQQGVDAGLLVGGAAGAGLGGGAAVLGLGGELA